MLLAIDIGNTNIEFGVFEGGNPAALGTPWHQPGRQAMKSASLSGSFCCSTASTTRRLEDVIIASVVPQIMYSMNNAIRKYLNKVPWSPGRASPIT